MVQDLLPQRGTVHRVLRGDQIYLIELVRRQLVRVTLPVQVAAQVYVLHEVLLVYLIARRVILEHVILHCFLRFRTVVIGWLRIRPLLDRVEVWLPLLQLLF